jgi:hypothetical protein
MKMLQGERENYAARGRIAPPWWDKKKRLTVSDADASF